MALPCRISIYPSRQTRIGMIRPEAMLASLFGDSLPSGGG